jgi:hypothetical protein
MAHSPSRLTPSLAGGLSLLGLQSATAPLFLLALSQPNDGTPRWLAAMYVALELGALAAGVAVLWGYHAKRSAARFAPAVLLLPFWAALAVAGPLAYDGVAAIAFAAVSLSMGVTTSLPFATAAGRAFFEPAPASPSLTSLTTTTD